MLIIYEYLRDGHIDIGLRLLWTPTSLRLSAFRVSPRGLLGFANFVISDAVDEVILKLSRAAGTIYFSSEKRWWTICSKYAKYCRAKRCTPWDVPLWKVRLNKYVSNSILTDKRIRLFRWRIQKFWKGGRAEDNLSAPSSFIANAHNEIYAFYMEKAAFWKKYEPIGGGVAPTLPPLWIRHWSVCPLVRLSKCWSWVTFVQPCPINS